MLISDARLKMQFIEFVRITSWNAKPQKLSPGPDASSSCGDAIALLRTYSISESEKAIVKKHLKSVTDTDVNVLFASLVNEADLQQMLMLKMLPLFMRSYQLSITSSSSKKSSSFEDSCVAPTTSLRTASLVHSSVKDGVSSCSIGKSRSDRCSVHELSIFPSACDNSLSEDFSMSGHRMLQELFMLSAANSAIIATHMTVGNWLDEALAGLNQHMNSYAVTVLKYSVGTVLTRSAFSFAYANDGFLSLSGYGLEDVIGSRVSLLFTCNRPANADTPAAADETEHHASAEDALAQKVKYKSIHCALMKGLPLKTAVRSYRRDGSCFLNLLALQPLRRGSQGELRGAVMVHSPIPLEKQQQQQQPRHHLQHQAKAAIYGTPAQRFEWTTRTKLSQVDDVLQVFVDLLG